MLISHLEKLRPLGLGEALLLGVLLCFSELGVQNGHFLVFFYKLLIYVV